MRKSAGFVIVTGAILIAAAVSAQESKPPSSVDPLGPIRFLEGTWEGTSVNENRQGKVERTYEPILDGRFLHGRNRTIYAANDQNPKAETHEEWSIFSLDKNRKTIILRQFHTEGFVNQYILNGKSDEENQLVFNTEAIENIPPGWQARETYKIISPDEFEETFEVAGPGKPFEPYSKARLKRKK